MLKKLRIKFIVINMMLAVLVLTTAFGVICYLDYSSKENAIYSQLGTTLSRVASSIIPQVEGVRPITSFDQPIASDVQNSNTRSSSTQDQSSGSSTDANTTSNASSNTAVNLENFFDPNARSGLRNATNRALQAQSSSNGTANSQTSAGTQTDLSTGDQASSGSSSTSSSTSSSSARVEASSKTGVRALVYDANDLVDSKSSDSIIVAPSIGDITTNPAPTILIAVYMVSDKGFYSSMPNFSVASVNDRVLVPVNELVLKSDADRGFLPEYDLCYERMPTQDGYIIAYADARSLLAWRSLALMLIGVGLAALSVFFLINLFFSRWALRPVELAMKMQQQFTADASHELKTPLTVILANMSILESQSSSTVAEQMQWVESTQTEAERMQLLVNDMLDLARPQDAKEKASAAVPLENVDFSDLVEGEVLQFESVAFERGVMIESDIEKNLYVKGNAERLGRMVATLVDNACKYAEDGGQVDVRLASVAVRPSTVNKTIGKHGVVPEESSRKRSRSRNRSKTTGRRGIQAVLTVHNNGTPIAPEDLPHLFDRFYRADKARTSGKGGYGLGLAIGRDIAREYDGDITVQSSHDEGTTFIVCLPVSSPLND